MLRKVNFLVEGGSVKEAMCLIYKVNKHVINGNIAVGQKSFLDHFLFELVSYMFSLL